MRIIKEGSARYAEDSIKLFKEHHSELGEIKYIILYYAEREWAICRSPEVYHQYIMIVGENAQLWLSSLTWGYYGAGPRALLILMQLIDPSITYEDIAGLEWEADSHPIMYEKVGKKLILKPFNETAKAMICNKNGRLPWDIRDHIFSEVK